MKKNIFFTVLMICCIAIVTLTIDTIVKEHIIANEKIEELEVENFVLVQENKYLNQRIENVECLYKEQQSIIENYEGSILEAIEPFKETNKDIYLILYKSLIKDIKQLEDEFTQEQIQIMYRCIETETYGCHINGKINVATVILNRIKSDAFPNDPIKIITSPNQFAYHKTNISEDTKLALEYAYLFGSEIDDCIAFRSDVCPQNWGKWNYYYTDEVGHHFYKFNK